MEFMLVMVSSLFLICIQTENITLNPGDEKLYSIFTGDTLTLQCPVNQPQKGRVRWSYMKDKMENILSIGEKINKNGTNFRFRVDFTNYLKNVSFLRIYNITSKEQRIYRCYYITDGGNTSSFGYIYNIQFLNIIQSMVRNSNGTLCCELHGQHISATNFIWEQRTLYDEHIRFIESAHKVNPGTLERNTDEAMHKHNHLVSCMNLNTNETVKYYQEGKYICLAQVFIYNRSQRVNKTTSIKIEDIQDQPFCTQKTKRQHSILGTNVRIVMNFYSKPNYSALSINKNDSDSKVRDMFTVSMKNISLNVYNAIVIVSGYEIIINITKFSEDDIGNYTVNVSNGLGYCNCTVQLLSQVDITIKRYPSGHVIEGQSVLFVCQSISRKSTHNYSWTKNDIVIANTSSVVLENITHDDNGNYTCRMKNEQRYITKNNILKVNPLSCTGYLPEPSEHMLTRFLGIGHVIVPFVLLIVSVICNIVIHLYCKKLKKVTFETDENDMSRERIEMTETDNEYHTINEDTFRIEDTETENNSEVTICIRESLDITGVQMPAVASGFNELQIEEDDYLHPYCTVMQNVIEVHEYKTIVQDVVQREVSDEVLNQGILSENLKY